MSSACHAPGPSDNTETLIDSGDTEAAIRQLEEELARHPGDAERYARLAGLYLEVGRGVPAIRAIERALELKPDSIRYMLIGSRVYRENGQPADALRLAETVLEQQGRNKAALLLAARAAAAAGKGREADVYLRQATNLLGADDPGVIEARAEVVGLFPQLAQETPDRGIYFLSVVHRMHVAQALVDDADVWGKMQAAWGLQRQAGITVVPEPTQQQWNASADALADAGHGVAADALGKCVRLGLFEPERSRVFPEREVSRGEMAQIVTRVLATLRSKPDLARDRGERQTFADLGESRYAAEAQVAASIGAMSGDAAARFRPIATLSGAELRQAVEALAGQSTASLADAPAPAEFEVRGPVWTDRSGSPARLRGFGWGFGDQPESAKREAVVRAVENALGLYFGETRDGDLPEHLAWLAERVVRGDLGSVTISEQPVYDATSHLGRARVDLTIDRAAFDRSADVNLAIAVRAAHSGRVHGTDRLVEAVRERLTQKGYVLLPDRGRNQADMIVLCDGRLERRSGEGGFFRFDGGLRIEVQRASGETIAQQRIPGEKEFCIASSERAAADKLFGNGAYGLASDYALGQLQTSRTETIGCYLILRGRPSSAALRGLEDALRQKGVGVRGVRVESAGGGAAKVRVGLDASLADSLRSVFDGLVLAGAGRIEIDAAAGNQLLGRIER